MNKTIYTRPCGDYVVRVSDAPIGGYFGVRVTLNGRRTDSLAAAFSTESSGHVVPITTELRDAVVRVQPGLVYAMARRVGKDVSMGELLLLLQCATHPEVEGFLNNPHGKSFAKLLTSWNETMEGPMTYDMSPDKLKAALRNWHNKDVGINVYVPMSVQSAAYVSWLGRYFTPVNSHVWSTAVSIEFGDKDIRYLTKLYGEDAARASVSDWLEYMGYVKEAVEEGHLPYAALKDDYWRHPSLATYEAKRDRVIQLLNPENEETNERELFNNHMDKYRAHALDMIVDGYRFYTSDDYDVWANHVAPLHQCCLKARYYLNNNILVFVEKDGKPYGTIEVEMKRNRVIQARITQENYRKSKMPDDVVTTFKMNVLPVMINR